MLLSDVLPHIEVLECLGDSRVGVCEVTRDSRHVRRGTIFVAIKGVSVDGHRFVSGLEEASVVVVEELVEAPAGVCVVRVPDTRRALPLLAAAVQGFPGHSLTMIGVTGTNGKTTVTTLLDEALRELGHRSARIGTTGTFADGRPIASELTTPESTKLQVLLREMLDSGIQAVSMEVSSIGLEQRRVDGIEYSVAIFTNLSRDHLDFHGDMARYAKAKSRLFSDLLVEPGSLPRVLACSDDRAWREMALPEDRWLFGFAEDADIRILRMTATDSGMRLDLMTPRGQVTIDSPLVGRFNALNVAAALGACVLLGFDVSAAAQALAKVSQVPGRMELIPNKRGFMVLVDYAHTPDAVSSVLEAAAELATGKVWVVLGCGGDRDSGKRPHMGRAAAEGADGVVVTSDNPRSESSLQIIEEILSGMTIEPAHVEPLRDRAIEWALHHASAGDVVVIAGKGHEDYQEISGIKVPFDDRLVARQILEGAWN